MSARPIWGSEGDTELAAARRAGWRRADLAWERLQEQGNASFLDGDTAGAARCFRRAGWLALWRLRGDDPRRATTLANLAFADRLAGREARARRRYAKARRIWGNSGAFIERMTIARRARSSLFHLRMEARHWETYQQNMRARMTAFAAEAGDALRALAEGREVTCRLYGRWRAEKPPVFDDTRKFLSAALMIAAPSARLSPDGAAGQGSHPP